LSSTPSSALMNNTSKVARRYSHAFSSILEPQRTRAVNLFHKYHVLKKYYPSGTGYVMKVDGKNFQNSQKLADHLDEMETRNNSTLSSSVSSSMSARDGGGKRKAITQHKNSAPLNKRQRRQQVKSTTSPPASNASKSTSSETSFYAVSNLSKSHTNHVCHKCGRPCTTASSLAIHLRVCKWNGSWRRSDMTLSSKSSSSKSSSSKSSSSKSSSSKSSSKSRKYPCYKCGKVCTAAGGLAIHVKFCKGTGVMIKEQIRGKNNKYPCHKCGKVCTAAPGLAMHIKFCKGTGVVASSPRVRLLHTINPVFCFVCNINFCDTITSVV